MKIYQNGDLINLAENGYFDVIIHGCNCFHKMGAGIALQIAKKYPKVVKLDKETKYGDVNKLGKFFIYNTGRYTIVNAYTQFHYGKGLQVDYNAVQQVFKKIKGMFSGKRIGYPKIGAGLAGGDWNIISSIIDKELIGEDHTLVLLN
jgi:O-acetyl-ADP-ribose deacetylase (regulator of RNase III)